MLVADVLSRSNKEELFASKTDAAQPQATESYLILQLTKLRLNFSALAQCMFESGSVGMLCGWPRFRRPKNHTERVPPVPRSWGPGRLPRGSVPENRRVREPGHAWIVANPETTLRTPALAPSLPCSLVFPCQATKRRNLPHSLHSTANKSLPNSADNFADLPTLVSVAEKSEWRLGRPLRGPEWRPASSWAARFFCKARLECCGTLLTPLTAYFRRSCEISLLFSIG